jgi:hypothetical protein
MPRHLYGPITESLRVQLCRTLEYLLTQAASDGDPDAGFEQARQVLEALPLATAEFSVARNRLANGRRYLQSGECGAARFELRLLLQSLND